MSDTVTISKTLFETILDMVSELQTSCLPGGITIPAEDREMFLAHAAAGSITWSEHLRTHWAEGTDASFTDYPEEGQIPHEESSPRSAYAACRNVESGLVTILKENPETRLFEPDHTLPGGTENAAVIARLDELNAAE